MTLVELLVVIVILTTVVAAAIPIMAPSNVDRQLRETSRTLNTFITGAQARAIASGRPYGIALKRLSAETGRNAPTSLSNPDNDNGVCLEVFYVEQPPAYTGYDRNSRVCVSLIREIGLVCIRFTTQGPTQNDRLPVGWDADLFPTGMIRPGDVIEIGDSRFELLDHRVEQLSRLRQQYVSVSFDKSNIYYEQQQNTIVQIIARPINDTGQQVYPEYDNDGVQLGEDRPSGSRPPYWTRPLPYKILRQATFASDEPYQLPEGTAIDLRASGVGNTFFYYPSTPGISSSGPQWPVDNDAPIFIMFSPEGRISRVTFNTVATTSTVPLANQKIDQNGVVDNVFLLVGRRENSPPPLVSADPTLNPSTFTPRMTDEQRSGLREQINWLNGDSRWVVIGAQTGRVVTIENGFADPLAAVSTGNLPPSSELLRSAQILAAREFAPEMSQLGGR